MSVPVPRPTPRGEEQLHFAAAREGRLIHQVCAACSSTIFPLRAVCPRCMSDELVVRDSPSTGVVYSFTTQHRAGHPAFADRVPYSIVLVDLLPGVRLLADLVDCAPEEFHIGMEVEVFFEHVDDELTLPRFRPLTASGVTR